MKPVIHSYPSGEISIPPMASWPASHHLFEIEHIRALQAAQATGRPLLLRGEAGTGKSQLAHAAAAVTGRAFLPVVVGSNTEAQDLHWKFDAIARLADAQVQARSDATSLDLRHYLQPGPLWWAFDWAGALAQQQSCRHGAAHSPATPENWLQQQGSVLLIDEIDKAEPDLPNGLLEALANGAFDVPLLGITVKPAADCAKPLIIITTNDERELPAAFLRRCLVLTLKMPASGQALLDWLCVRGKMHCADLPDEVLLEAARLLQQDREAAREQGCYLPGLAEYLDLLRAVQEMGEQGISCLINDLKHFYFEKQPLASSLSLAASS